MSYKEISYFCKIDDSMQPAMFFQASGNEPRPLVVALHTWSYDHSGYYEGYMKNAERYNWHLIFPKFRGPNWLPEGCGSEMVVSDLEDAVSYMKSVVNVDSSRIYLVGGSGGGHCSLLMAGRRPDLWSGVSSWCPISDIAAWHRESMARKNEYGKHIEDACGGDPQKSASAAWEARKRSPLTWLANARNAGLSVDISTGIHDGHTGSVPVSHAFNAFNVLADEEDRFSEDEIDFIVEKEMIPEHLRFEEEDPAYGDKKVLLRRQSGSVRLTIFEGGHDIIGSAAFDWLSRQVANNDPDWGCGSAAAENGKSELSR